MFAVGCCNAFFSAIGHHLTILVGQILSTRAFQALVQKSNPLKLSGAGPWGRKKHCKSLPLIGGLQIIKAIIIFQNMCISVFAQIFFGKRSCFQIEKNADVKNCYLKKSTKCKSLYQNNDNNLRHFYLKLEFFYICFF